MDREPLRCCWGSPPSTVESKTALRLLCFRGESRLGAVLVVPGLFSRLWLTMARVGVSSGVLHSLLWLYQALLGASLVFPTSSTRHQFESFTSFVAASLLESSSCAFFVRRQEVSRICHSVAVSLLGLATIPVPAYLLYKLGGDSSKLLFDWEVVSSAMYNLDLVASAKFMVLLKRHEKPRHPRQGGEPHLLVIIVNGR
ncbi:hypothetical protein F2Q69_00019968 [Brassica cretica]|uniref:Uncharacterized protein n=1 Tax=Brassica cretica TaxID=69181 RepID=A0A8S9QGV3_BRACR|nr:hypothetical protein F2Q69_00019968 [Brassica cretica]